MDNIGSDGLNEAGEAVASLEVDDLAATVELLPIENFVFVDPEATSLESGKYELKERLIKVYFSENLPLVLETLPHLKDEIERAISDPSSGFLGRLDPLPEQDFGRMIGDIDGIMARTTEDNKYHNRDHPGEVLELALDVVTELEALGLYFDEVDKQCGYLAIAYHDVAHCGKLGADYPDGDNIERTLMEADSYFKGKNVPLEMRLKILCIIKATESFNKGVKPDSPMEVVAVLSDIGNFYRGFESFMKNNQKVMMEMHPPVVSDVKSWKAQVDFFLGEYCVDKIEEFRAVAARIENKALSKFLDKLEEMRVKVLLICSMFAIHYRPNKDDEWYSMVDELIVDYQSRSAQQ
jgi:hypothetical protein